jgi:hypothetical protein
MFSAALGFTSISNNYLALSFIYVYGRNEIGKLDSE